MVYGICWKVCNFILLASEFYAFVLKLQPSVPPKSVSCIHANTLYLTVCENLNHIVGTWHSGVAGIILAISCCAAIRKLDPGRISRPLFCISIEDALVKLMNLSHSLVSLDKLHHLASEAGFEEDFLLHFGRKVLPCKNTEDIEFWIGLVQKKLSAAFYRESVSTHRHMFHNKVSLYFVLISLLTWRYKCLNNPMLS
mgnify:CR=1 FL=1